MSFGEVLADQGRPEIVIVLAHQVEHTDAVRIAEIPVAPPSTFARYNARGAFGSQSLEQTENLAPLHSEQRRGVLDPQLAALHAHQRIKPR